MTVDMADEVYAPNALTKPLEQAEWKETGIQGFLTGRVWRGKVYVLNVWTLTTSLSKDLATCQCHLSSDSNVLGVVVVSKSDQLVDAENHLQSLSEEIQIQMSVPDPMLVVCTVQLSSQHPKVSFHQLCPEDGKLRKLMHLDDLSDLGSEEVTFRLHAQLPLQVQVDSGGGWGVKVTKAFDNMDFALASESFLFGIHDTNLFLSATAVFGTRKSLTTVHQLQSHIADLDDSSSDRKKKAYVPQSPVLVDMYQQVSGNTEHFAQPTCAPAVQQRTGMLKSLQMTLPLDVVVDVDVREKLTTLLQLFTKALRAQLKAIRHCLLHHHMDDRFHVPEPFHFLIPNRHTCVTVIYPKGFSDAKLEPRRRYLHDRMCLGVDQPVFRRANSRLFPGEKAEGGYIVNPHIGLPPSGVPDGTPHIVKGNYSYHHYMQDRFDDNKWGCAYRSLQTVVSWFRFQGYTDKPVPSHREIQESLVAVGDKESSFIGSKKWIGSFEVSFCLDHLLGVTSKFLSVSAGAELASKGRELAQHFDTEGTPIMIGGGVLAHTILGVDYSESLGDIKFLILDPHYTGGEDLPTIQREGWCGWKDSNFWNPTAHYNLCMPLRPKCF